MARKKTAKKANKAQQRRSITQMKANPIKLNGVNKNKSSKQLATQFNQMTGSPRRTRKQTREGLRENLQQTHSTYFTMNNNLKPSTSSIIHSRDQKKNRKSTTDTIVIEDSDEENDSNGNAAAPKLLFYLDRNPGIRETEVPLYNVCHKIGSDPVASADHHPAINPDESVIVLDNTIDQTMNDSMKEMQVDVKTVQPSSTDIVCTGSITSSSNSSSNIVPNVQIDKKSKPSTSAPAGIAEVIDLSDYSDSDPIVSSAQTATPAFPAQDCIPLGYDVQNLQPNRNVGNQRPPKKNRWDKGLGDVPNSSKTPPVPVTKPVEEIETKKRMVIIDGNNVAFGHLNGKMFSVKGLDLCIKYFKRLGHEVTAVVPQFRLKKHQSTDYVLLEKLHRNGDVTLAPSKNLPGQCSSTYDDRLIMSVAEQFDGVIISNDNFRDLLDISPAWRQIIETRVIGYTWVKDCFFLPDDPYGRYGPTLQQILNGKSI